MIVVNKILGWHILLNDWANWTRSRSPDNIDIENFGNESNPVYVVQDISLDEEDKHTPI